MKKITIAIDGHSSTGKSSISKAIAQKLGLIHLDTGALYRGITFFGLKNYSNENHEINIDALIQNLNRIVLEFREENGDLVLYMNGENINIPIRSIEVSENVSLVAKQPEVRAFLLETQRKIAKNGGIIMDGRDIGTVVLPDADYKFFITASVEERARRRFLELTNSGIITDEEAVKKNLIARDKTDSERTTAPLKQAEDAILIDNTHLNKEESIELILSYLLPR
ncbi:MAG: (d)CMP kinase [Cloacibacterium sp.]|nr:(d)CMP kinase [Cloacibacterium sp.]